MISPNFFYKTLTPLATALVSLVAFHNPVLAAESVPVTNYTTAIPDQPEPYLMPYGYDDTARATPQVVMAGFTPSVIDKDDTSFEILALVRPGKTAMQTVRLVQGQNANPLFNIKLNHINTLKNGDQFWKATYTFQAGAFGGFSKGIVPIKWGTGADQFSIQASDTVQGFDGNPFPLLSFGSFPKQTVFVDTTKDDVLSYKTTKRVVPQIVMAGVSPAVVDLKDTSFDIVTILRPGLVPIQDVVLKQGANNLFSVALEKKKIFTNGDEVWVAKFPFAAGTFGTSTIPVVWGTSPGEYNIQVVDIAQQSSTAYPDLRVGAFPVQLPQ